MAVTGGPASFSDFLLAAGAPQDVAVIDGQRAHTYEELRTAAARIAGELAGLGLAPGARIGLLGGNSFFWVAAYLAALKAHGASPWHRRSFAPVREVCIDVTVNPLA